MEKAMSKVQKYLQKIYVGNGWWNISRFWDRLKIIAEQRDKQKLHYKSTKNWSSQSSHFLGLLGEMAFSLETGIKIDLLLRAEGDGGLDFNYDGKFYDVKGTQYWKDPHLKQYPNPKKWCDYYVLAGIRTNEHLVKIFGWTSKENLQKAHLVDYGYGNQRSIPYSELNKDLPEWLPSLKRKFEVSEPI